MFNTINLAILATRSIDGILGESDRLPLVSIAASNYFSKIIRNKPVIMSKDVHDRLDKPFLNCINIVIGNDVGIKSGFWQVETIEDALEIAEIRARANNAKEILVIGGVSLFNEILDSVNKLYLAQFNGLRKKSDKDKLILSLDESEWLLLNSESTELLLNKTNSLISKTALKFEEYSKIV